MSQKTNNLSEQVQIDFSSGVGIVDDENLFHAVNAYEYEAEQARQKVRKEKNKDNVFWLALNILISN